MNQSNIPHGKTFEEEYPYITSFVLECGKIEIGYGEYSPSFVIAYDEGGTVFEGKDDYETMSQAFADLEKGIKQFIEENGI